MCQNLQLMDKFNDAFILNKALYDSLMNFILFESSSKYLTLKFPIFSYEKKGPRLGVITLSLRRKQLSPFSSAKPITN